MSVTRICPPYDPDTHRPVDEWVETPDPDHNRIVAVQVIAALSPVEIAQAAAEALAARVASVKAEAARRILAIAPEWMQRNLTARAAELALLYPGTRGDELPEEERSEYLAGQATWGRIRAIRAASNGIEAALVAAHAAGGSAAVWEVDIAAGWPE